MTSQDIEYIIQHKDFVQNHITDDPIKLLLKYAKDAEKKLLIEQIASRQKVRKKLPSWYSNYDLVFLPGLSLEQSSSEDTGSLKASLLLGSHLLDITGGMGVDTYFLSQNFEKSTYVEKNQELFITANHNLSSLSKRIETINGDGAEMLKKSSADMVYIDPFRRDSANNKMVSLTDCEPNVLALKPWLTENNRTSCIKASPMIDIHTTISDLQDVCEVWVISSRNECKEVIFKVQKTGNSDVKVKTYNITPNGTETFNFELSQITNTKVSLSEPLTFLYEPNASVLKSGGQNLLSTKLDVSKLHPNSNFFTSGELINSFPGKTFKINQILAPFDKSLKKGRFNVISRNFPKKASEIEKKLKLLSDKENYLIATKTNENKYIFITATLL